MTSEVNLVITPIQTDQGNQPRSEVPAASYFALIPAAGVGSRMAASCPKQYLRIAGKSILQHCVDAFVTHPAIRHVFVVVSPDDEYVKTELASHDRMSLLHCGGASRSASVLNGLHAIQDRLRDSDWVLVHDAARPGINCELINRLIEKVGANSDGGLLAIPVVDTVKRETESHVETLPRTGLWLAQTPQMFRFAELTLTLEGVADNYGLITDEASAMEMAGFKPMLVEGHWRNNKITHPNDLALIEFGLTNTG